MTQCDCTSLDKLAGNLCYWCVEQLMKETYGDLKVIAHEVMKIEEAARNHRPHA